MILKTTTKSLIIALCWSTALAQPVKTQIVDGLNPASITRKVILSGSRHVHISGDDLAQCAFNFDSPDAWLFIDRIAPSKVLSDHMKRMFVGYEPAFQNANVRIQSFGTGTVVIPQGRSYEAMTAYDGKSLKGTPKPFICGVKYDSKTIGELKGGLRSFRLKRGYMATLAEKKDGTGVSRNYVAQDRDIEIESLPKELDQNVGFIRIFPWRWTTKKGIAGGIWQNLNVGWFYDWNVGARSSADIEYVPIRQKRWWPSLNQDWQTKGATHLLGYNEPDRKDQANLKVSDAIWSWPDLLGTGLRLGSPAVSDGGLKWLYEFIDQADAANLRVDFVAVHYYRAVSDPGDGKAAAAQMYNFLKGIHERTKRPIWITEWNNGANWTGGRDPNEKEQRKAIEEMIKMLDKTPFVERYALYNWVEDGRKVLRNDNTLTPAGEEYRNKVSPPAYRQEKP